MSNLDDFLKNPYGHDTGSGKKPVIARASVWPAWEVSVTGTTKEYFKFKHGEENELTAKVQAENLAGSNGYTSLGILTTIYAKSAIQSNFNEDWNSFVKAYESEEKFYVSARGKDKLTESGHMEAVQVLIDNGGPFPYDQFIEYLKNNPEVFEDTKYCRLIQIDNEVLKAKGVTNSAGYSYQFFAIDKVYDSREGALADNPISTLEPVIEASADEALSETAAGNNWTFIMLEKEAPTILSKVNELVGKSKVPKVKDDAIVKTAGEYGIAPADIRFLIETSVPF